MEQLIKLVSEKTGISESQAKTAVTTVMNFLKEKMPEGMGSQMENLMKGGSISDMAGGLKDKIGGMFGK